jgi:hypothetical protein
MCFRKSSIAGTSQAASPDSLSMGAFDACAWSIRDAELLSGLLRSHRLKRFVIFADLQTDDTGLQF